MKKQKKMHMFNWLFLAALVLLLGAGLWGLWTNNTQYREQQKEYKKLEEEYKQARLDLEGEKRMLEYAKSDEYIERMARKMFKWSKENEIIFQNVQENNALTTASGESISTASSDTETEIEEEN